jgi:hypothetical protein
MVCGSLSRIYLGWLARGYLARHWGDHHEDCHCCLARRRDRGPLRRKPCGTATGQRLRRAARDVDGAAVAEWAARGPGERPGTVPWSAANLASTVMNASSDSTSPRATDTSRRPRRSPSGLEAGEAAHSAPDGGPFGRGTFLLLGRHHGRGELRQESLHHIGSAGTTRCRVRLHLRSVAPAIAHVRNFSTAGQGASTRRDRKPVEIPRYGYM